MNIHKFAAAALAAVFFTASPVLAAGGAAQPKPSSSTPEKAKAKTKADGKVSTKRHENIARPSAQNQIVVNLKGVQAQLNRRYITSQSSLNNAAAAGVTARREASTAEQNYNAARQRYQRTGLEADRQLQRSAASQLTRARGNLANAKNTLMDSHNDFQETRRQRREITRAISAARAGDWFAAAQFSENADRQVPAPRAAVVRFAQTIEVREADMSEAAVQSRLGYNKSRP
jgi:hypothetical protein